ncbi:hypothetical protein ANCCEY_05972 [Ancylostoma ceylanicum]|uniref:Phospholipid/glycerol acyltransferase domain-containing protein n=1 Tax=Ancylostoma ceylanicum TaxID=53326 RepID=A0A0D6LS79_9BILA|nr:hypothetical protein ANCCEY_05972 [Ancylostoma ceylanicum]
MFPAKLVVILTDAKLVMYESDSSVRMGAGEPPVLAAGQPFWSLMSYVFGAKVRVRGDMIDHSKPAVIIMNHRTRLDWLYFWNALYKMDPWLCTSEKITLKGVLKYLPGAGLV